MHLIKLPQEDCHYINADRITDLFISDIPSDEDINKIQYAIVAQLDTIDSVKVGLHSVDEDDFDTSHTAVNENLYDIRILDVDGEYWKAEKKLDQLVKQLTKKEEK